MAVNDPLFNQIKAYLDGIGLGALATVNADGSPGGWLWDQIQSGWDDDSQLMMALESTDVWKNRFGVIVEQKRRAAAGLPEYVMTPEQVLGFEKTITEAMTAAGLPSWFYDTPEDFQSLMLNHMSPDEVKARIQDSYEYVTNAPPEVRQKFEEFYGVGQGDAALAAYVLDPARTAASLEQSRRSAYTAGLAKRFDLQVTQAMAERIAQLPRTEGGIVEGLTNIQRQALLLQESPFETTDITADMALAAEFEGDSAALNALERRQLERSAPNRSATGGAILTNQGLQGAGTAGG